MGCGANSIELSRNIFAMRDNDVGFCVTRQELLQSEARNLKRRDCRKAVKKNCWRVHGRGSHVFCWRRKGSTTSAHEGDLGITESEVVCR